MKEPQTEPDTRTERQKFEDLARKVLSVPKREIDRRQTEYERHKTHSKRGKQLVKQRSEPL